MQMKKFINDPNTLTDELLEGLALAHADTVDVQGHLVISRALESADRVTIVTFGGSGHEPAQCGFVGEGMVDIQVVGDIFAAPNPQLVFEAVKMADKGHGVLLLVLNHAGDMLCGNMVMKMAGKAGLNVRKVVTQEDISNAPRSNSDDRRGLAGAIGMTIGDLLDPIYVVYAPKTFLLKLCIGLIAGLIAHRMGHITHTSDKKKILLWTILASAGGLVFNMVADPLVGYFYKLLILGKPAADITLAWNIASTSINAVLSAIVSVAVYMALRPALQKAGLFWRIGKEENKQ